MKTKEGKDKNGLVLRVIEETGTQVQIQVESSDEDALKTFIKRVRDAESNIQLLREVSKSRTADNKKKRNVEDQMTAGYDFRIDLFLSNISTEVREQDLCSTVRQPVLHIIPTGIYEVLMNPRALKESVRLMQQPDPYVEVIIPTFMTCVWRFDHTPRFFASCSSETVI